MTSTKKGLHKINTKSDSIKSTIHLLKEERSNVVIRKRPIYDFQDFKYGLTHQQYLNRMRVHGSDGYIRETIWGHEIIWNYTKYILNDKPLDTKKKVNSRKDFNKSFFLFAMVKRDALKYIKRRKVEPIRLPNPFHENNTFNKPKAIIMATDIDNAYWEIAYKLGVISDNTYRKGIVCDNKEVMLASLASLGKDQLYTLIEKGVITEKKLLVQGNEKLKNAYKLIRNECYKHMQKLAKMLGDDYSHWKVDCIYYVKSKKNVDMVEKYLDDNDLEFKTQEGRLTSV